MASGGTASLSKRIWRNAPRRGTPSKLSTWRRLPGCARTRCFSALAPHTEIPPHTGETNARLVVHLPLVVPEKCTYRVGFEHRTWKEGELLIFDDTIEHTARNDSDQLRVVLIFDVWNPLLAPEERDIVRALAAATRDHAARPS
jgi:aspartate beta-hydroxylase